MRALAISGRGVAPAVIDVSGVAPAAGEISVTVEAASLNGFDLAVAAGYLWDQMPHTFPVILGRDFAGTVTAVGADVERPAVGDRVAGLNTAMELGAGPIAATFVTGAASTVPIPDGVNSTQAAAIGLAGITALDIVTALAIASGDTVLVAGATGGVGAYVVQLAAARGAHVVATARPGAASDFVTGLGATSVVDYTDDLAAAVRRVAPDGIAKVVHTAGDAAELGALVATGGQLASVIGATAEQVGRADVEVIGVMGTYTPEKLTELLGLATSGALTVPVAATFGLAEAAAAIDAFPRGKLGKIVVTQS